MIKFFKSFFTLKFFTKPVVEVYNFQKPTVVLKDGKHEIRVYKMVTPISFEEAIMETQKAGGKLLGHQGIDIFRSVPTPECLSVGSALFYSMGETAELRSYLLHTGEYYFFANNEHLRINAREYVIVIIEL